MPSRRVRSTMSSSMQPPDTEPATRPSSRTASIAPSGRGELPHVFTTVTSSTRRPCVEPLGAVAAALRDRRCPCVISAHRVSDSRARTARSSTTTIADDRRVAHPRRRRRRGAIGGGASSGRSTPALRGIAGRRRARRRVDEAREEIVGDLRRGAVDEPRADLRELAADLRLRDVRQRGAGRRRRRERDARLAARESRGAALPVELQRVASRRRRCRSSSCVPLKRADTGPTRAAITTRHSRVADRARAIRSPACRPSAPPGSFSAAHDRVGGAGRSGVRQFHDGLSSSGRACGMPAPPRARRPRQRVREIGQRREIVHRQEIVDVRQQRADARRARLEARRSAAAD